MKETDIEKQVCAQFCAAPLILALYFPNIYNPW